MTVETPAILLVACLSWAAAAGPQPGDADYPTRNGNPRHEEKTKAVRAGDYDLVLVGDSITHSIGELDGKYAPNRAVWDRHFAPRHAINLGMNGQRTEEILWNLQNGELDFTKAPKVVMLLIGTNNSDDRRFRTVNTPEQIFAGTKAIVDLIRERHPTTKILVLRIFPRGGDNEKSVSPPAFNSSAQCIETCRRAGELTAKLADGEHVFWLDVNHVFVRPDGTIHTDLMWDLLHPSPAGTEAWVQAVEPTLAKLMGDQPILDPAPLSGAPASSHDVVIQVHADQVLHPVSRLLTGACIEDVNHEIYGGLYSQMVFGESFQEPAREPGISGMWRGIRRGEAKGQFAILAEKPFIGTQSQQVTFESGSGEWGVENQGLNRWGMHFVANHPYEGYVWVRAEKPVQLFAALESRDGSRVHAEKSLDVAAGEWCRLDFTLTPAGADKTGRLVLKLKQPGSVTLGHAFLQPGAWGRFKGLPVRKDVAEALTEAGVTVLRYGGSMVNNVGYRWKQMIGPRDRRQPYAGHWYRHSSNGWGIADFMELCEAAGFESIPAFNMDETPQDMADFIDYAKGPADSTWGRRREADGHPAPYRLKYIELGNEERVDDAYAAKFEALARAIWTKDPDIILVVGDFVYDQPLRDPFHFGGSAAGITTLAAQQKILRLAKQQHHEVWFDLHIGTDGPQPDATFAGMFSFIDALERIADGARFKVVVFEFNGGNHTQKRALANALAINAIERDGRIPVAASANCLQPDGQNDNGWDQGLLFLNPSQVWLQPPGYVTQMISRNFQPLLVKCETTGPPNTLDVAAKRSEDGKTLVLQVVNPGDTVVAVRMRIDGIVSNTSEARVEELSGPLNAANSADQPASIVPRNLKWKRAVGDEIAPYSFPPHSFTVLRFE